MQLNTNLAPAAAAARPRAAAAPAHDATAGFCDPPLSPLQKLGARIRAAASFSQAAQGRGSSVGPTSTSPASSSSSSLSSSSSSSSSPDAEAAGSAHIPGCLERHGRFHKPGAIKQSDIQKPETGLVYCRNLKYYDVHFNLFCSFNEINGPCQQHRVSLS
jgi:hypothetical protein